MSRAGILRVSKKMRAAINDSITYLKSLSFDELEQQVEQHMNDATYSLLMKRCIRIIKRDYNNVLKHAPSSAKAFKECPADDLIRYHSSMGAWVRNEAKLWSFPWTPELVDGIDESKHHPDNLSMEAIRIFHASIQD